MEKRFVLKGICSHCYPNHNQELRNHSETMGFYSRLIAERKREQERSENYIKMREEFEKDRITTVVTVDFYSNLFFCKKHLQEMISLIKNYEENSKLEVITEGTAGPYITVKLSQLDDVRKILDQNNIKYSVEEDAISYDGGPYTLNVNLDYNVDVQLVQNILNATTVNRE